MRTKTAGCLDYTSICEYSLQYMPNCVTGNCVTYAYRVYQHYWYNSSGSIVSKLEIQTRYITNETTIRLRGENKNSYEQRQPESTANKLSSLSYSHPLAHRHERARGRAAHKSSTREGISIIISIIRSLLLPGTMVCNTWYQAARTYVRCCCYYFVALA